jgi:hypothetical protein
MQFPILGPEAQMDRETVYLEPLQPDRCPLCFVVRAYVYEHLKSLLDECVTDPSTRDHLFQSKGFCRRHAWQGVHQRQALGMGVIYGSLLQKGLKELSSQSRFWKFNKPKPCPICESEKNREQSCVKEFAFCWSDSEKLRKAFSERGILCLPHLEGVLTQKMSPAQRKNLHETGKKALERLLQELNEFLEKQDYHRSQESLGQEWDAWIRAVRMISGERD